MAASKLTSLCSEEIEMDYSPHEALRQINKLAATDSAAADAAVQRISALRETDPAAAAAFVEQLRRQNGDTSEGEDLTDSEVDALFSDLDLTAETDVVLDASDESAIEAAIAVTEAYEAQQQPLHDAEKPTDAPVAAALFTTPMPRARSAALDSLLGHIGAYWRKSGRRFISPFDPLANEKRALENRMQRDGHSELGVWQGLTLDDLPEGFWQRSREERNAIARKILRSQALADADLLRANRRRKARTERRLKQGYPADLDQRPPDEQRKIKQNLRKRRSRDKARAAKSVTGCSGPPKA